MKRKVIATAHHRNGISGAPFDIVLFRDDDGSTKVGICFDNPLDIPNEFTMPKVAILDVNLLADGEITFAGPNCFRGDVFAKFIHDIIQERSPE